MNAPQRNVKIEAGKFYADGHGRKRGPMQPRLRHAHPDVWGEHDGVDLWMGDGSPFDAPHSMHPELVAEWAEHDKSYDESRTA